MKRKLAALLALGALAIPVMGAGGCNEKHGTGTAGKSTTTESPEQKKLSEGFHNMDALAGSIKDTYNEKSHNGDHVSNVDCIQTGKQTATCHLEGTEKDYEGKTEPLERSIEISIAENGESWISK